MPYYISHQSALNCYRSPKVIREIARAIESYGYVSGSLLTTEHNPKRARSIAEHLEIPLPLDVLIPDDIKRNRSEPLHVHLWREPVAPGSFVQLTRDIYISSPAFTLQQVAASKSPIENIRIASELCSIYTPNKKTGMLSKRQQLTNKEELLNYYSHSKSKRGLAKAIQAAKYALERARSPKEIEIGMLLTLPRSMGGRGIKDIKLNHRIELNEEARLIAKRKYLESDAFIESLRDALEYDSDDFHLTRISHESDLRKANALHLLGINLITLTNGQLHDWGTFDTIASVLEAKAHPRYHVTTFTTKDKQHALWETLLFRN